MLRLLRVRPIGMFCYGMADWVDLDGQGLVELIGINRDRHNSSNGCLSGDTLIDCPRDLRKYQRGIPIKELVGEQPWVYCWENGEIVVRQASRVFCSKRNEPVVRVKLTKYAGKSGSGYGGKYLPPQELVGTADHPVMLIDGSWKPLGELAPGDRVCSLYRRESGRLKLVNHTVLSVETAGRQDVYDMTVPGVHNFVANGVVVHNSGKSSLFDSITTIGWGRNNRESDVDAVVNKVWKRGCLGTLEFISPDESKCRVTLARQWKTRVTLSDEPSEIIESGHGYLGTTLYLEKWDPARKIWADYRAKTMLLTQEKCIEWMGMDYNMFCSVGYLAQGRVLQFMHGKAADREKIITDLLKLSVYSDAAKLAHEQAIELRKQMEVERAVIAEKTALFSSLPILEEVNKQEFVAYISARDRDILEVDRKVQEYQHSVKQQQLVSYAPSTHTTVAELQSDINNKHKQITGVDAEAHRIKTVQNTKRYELSSQKYPAFIEAENACLVASHEISRLESYSLGLSTLGGKCDVCGSVLTQEHLAQERVWRQTMLVKAKQNLSALNARKLEVAQSVTEARAIRMSALEAGFLDELSGHESKKIGVLKEIEAAEQRVRALRSVQDTEEQERRRLQESVMQMQAAITELQKSRESHVVAKHVAEERVATSVRNEKLRDEVRTRLADNESRVGVLEADLKYYLWWAKHMDILKIRKIGAASKTLNALIQSYLALVTDGDLQAWVVPYRVRSTAKKKENLTSADYIFEPELVIREGKKEGVPSEMYSGGEQGLVMLCLLFSFWELANKNGRGVNLLACDEIFGRWDEYNASQVLGLLGRVKKKVSTIILTTHQKSVKGILDVDHVWSVEKKNHLSQISVI